MTHRWTREQIEATLEVSPERIPPIMDALIDSVVSRAEQLDALDAAASAKAISANGMTAWCRLGQQYRHYLDMLGLPPHPPSHAPTNPQRIAPHTPAHHTAH